LRRQCQGCDLGAREGGRHPCGRKATALGSPGNSWRREESACPVEVGARLLSGWGGDGKTRNHGAGTYLLSLLPLRPHPGLLLQLQALLLLPGPLLLDLPLARGFAPGSIRPLRLDSFPRPCPFIA